MAMEKIHYSIVFPVRIGGEIVSPKVVSECLSQEGRSYRWFVYQWEYGSRDGIGKPNAYNLLEQLMEIKQGPVEIDWNCLESIFRENLMIADLLAIGVDSNSDIDEADLMTHYCDINDVRYWAVTYISVFDAQQWEIGSSNLDPIVKISNALTNTYNFDN